MQDTPGLVKSYPMLVSTWASMRLLHLWLRYLSLSALQFNTINLKRARMLVQSHILQSRVPEIHKATDYIWCAHGGDARQWEIHLDEQLKTLLRLYAREKYILVVNQQRIDFEVFVSFKVGATSVSVLRSVWQTYWLHENLNVSEDIFDQLAKSLSMMDERFNEFIQQLDKGGWDIHQINLRVPKEISIDECPV
ncbi:hypothetical protein GOBAR_AA08226 [Gossypium barbadense]|uniref:Root UVB sensitive protein C-terminal domain-containing protein n=1 Tax=Gossypium barbadense TaxID=3634 RepID=A0A2P5YA12_GOSBA|nr:hypothetical protein GOBAR_AA08226 [Gossypium barbadense]